MVEWRKLGEICTDVIVPMRDRPKIFDGSIPWCRIEDIEGMYFNKSLSGLMVSEDVIKKMNLKVFPIGTVICSCSATLGVCAINTQPLITNQTFIGLVCSNEVLNRYMYYYMSTRKKELLSLATTGTIPYVSREKFENMQVPIPSLSEQNRIVGILDTFTASIDNLKEQIAQRRKQYEYYRDQLLALEGKEGVEMKTMGELCNFIRGPFGGALKKEIFVSDGYAIYEQQHAIYGEWSFRYFIDEKKFNQMKRFEVHAGDILMSCSGTMGKTSIIPENYKEGIINQALLKLSTKDEISNKFLKLLMDSLLFQDALKGKTAGGAIQNVASVSVLKNIHIPVPSLQEQQRIVDILDKFEASIQNLEAQLSQREKQYEYYRNKLLTFE